MYYGSSASYLFATNSAFEISPLVPPKDDSAADDKDIDLKPSARSGSSPPPSAPSCGSSMLCGSSAFPLFATTSASEVHSPVHMNRTTQQLLLCVLIKRINKTGKRKELAALNSL
jgi:hypothetical protein